MRPLVRWGLWQRRTALLWWCLGIAAFVAVSLVFYPSFKDQAAELNKSLDTIPDSARALITDTDDLFSPVGYLSSQVYYLMLPLLLSILAIGQGANALGREERERSIELLLARPLSRGRLLVGKALVALLNVGIVAAVGTVTIVIITRLVDITVPVGDILLAALMATLLALSFGAIAFFVSALGRAGRGASIGIASIVALAGYVISSMAATVSWLSWPAKFMPFHYYHPAEILQGTFDLTDAAVLGTVTIAFGLLAFAVFKNRDLQ